MKCKRVVVVAAVAALALGACSSDKKTGSSTGNGNGSASGTVTVYASGVFKDIVDRLVKVYTSKHTAVKFTVVTKVQPKALKAQVDAGRPSIVLLVNQQFRPLGTSLKPVALGRDPAVIVVSTKNPHKVTDITAFAATSGLKTATCGLRTGFGNTTQWVLYVAKVKPDPKTIGVACEVKAMQQVAKDELDAVLLFRGSVFPPKGVKLLDIPEKQNIVFNLSYLVVGKSPAVTQFGAFLAGPGARRLLTLNGYLP